MRSPLLVLVILLVSQGTVSLNYFHRKRQHNAQGLTGPVSGSKLAGITTVLTFLGLVIMSVQWWSGMQSSAAQEAALKQQAEASRQQAEILRASEESLKTSVRLAQDQADAREKENRILAESRKVAEAQLRSLEIQNARSQRSLELTQSQLELTQRQITEEEWRRSRRPRIQFYLDSSATMIFGQTPDPILDVNATGTANLQLVVKNLGEISLESGAVTIATQEAGALVAIYGNPQTPSVRHYFSSRVVPVRGDSAGLAIPVQLQIPSYFRHITLAVWIHGENISEQSFVQVFQLRHASPAIVASNPDEHKKGVKKQNPFKKTWLYFFAKE